MRARIEPLLCGLEYLYHLRFALLLWAAPALLAYFADSPHKPSPFLHAIFTPQYIGQFFIATFFASCTGVLGLILARIVCINGIERFDRPAPHWLFGLLGISEQWPSPPGQRDWAGLALAASQIPTLTLLWRLHQNSADAGVRLRGDLYYSVPMLFGLVAAAIFWWVVDMAYHATYPRDLFQRDARTLLYPRSFLYKQQDLENAQPPDGLLFRKQNGFLYAVFRGIFAVLAKGDSGYCERTGKAKGQLYEGHRVAAIGLIGYLIVYALFYPLTAPASIPLFGSVLLWSAVVLAAVIAVDQLSLLKGATWTMKLFFLLPLLVFVVCLIFLGWTRHIGQAPFVYFPVLASVLILFTLLCSVFAGVAFYLDRYKLPALISFIVIILVLPRIFIHGTGEHYFPALARNSRTPLPTPSEILTQRCAQAWTNQKPCNMLFITATGGGIHAAVWTAGILNALEQDFAAQLPSESPFHEQLAFASTVSGGSVGLSDFLRHYPSAALLQSQHPEAYDPAHFIEASNEAACSGLEAVSWGLIYSDFWHVVLPLRRHTPGWDRSYALELALERNAITPQCRWTPAERTSSEKRQALTLDDFALTPATISHYPAFTMNTTAVEKGGRFLLANYQNDATLHSFAPAASFETVYDANLSLATAARLSATYPVVSSAARVIPTFGPEWHGTRSAAAAHFVDGGYYDNDGIASAIEFIEGAYLNHKQPLRGKVNILMIEIRDSPDVNWAVDEESAQSQAQYPHPLDLIGQADAPLVAFYNTGHGGVSRRNFMEVERLESALPAEVKLYAQVLPYDETTALSWQLTPKQRLEISGKIDGLRKQRANIVAWEKWKSAEGPPPPDFLPKINPPQ